MTGNVRPKRARIRRERNSQDPRTGWVSARVSSAERAEITANATRAGMTVGGWLVAAGLRQDTTALALSGELRELIGAINEASTEVRRLGNNYNQIARVTNATGQVPEGEAESRAAADAVVAQLARAIEATVAKLHSTSPA